MKPAAINAMKAIFDFAEAMDDGDLSIADLHEAMKESIECGFDMLWIQLRMAAQAVMPMTSKGMGMEEHAGREFSRLLWPEGQG